MDIALDSNREFVLVLRPIAPKAGKQSLQSSSVLNELTITELINFTPLIIFEFPDLAPDRTVVCAITNYSSVETI